MYCVRFYPPIIAFTRNTVYAYDQWNQDKELNRLSHPTVKPYSDHVTTFRSNSDD